MDTIIKLKAMVKVAENIRDEIRSEETWQERLEQDNLWPNREEEIEISKKAVKLYQTFINYLDS